MFTLNNKISKNILLSCDHGTFIINRFDCNKEMVGSSQWLLDHGNASSLEAQIAYSHINNKKNPIIFDIGANIGTFSSWMAKAFPEGKIYSFEPQRLIFQMICGNMAINNIDNVYLYNTALGKENKILTIQEPDYFQNVDYGTFSIINDVIEKKSKYESIIDLTTLDDFVKKYNIINIDFIKVDAEGMDLEILLGATNSINKFLPSILVEHNDNKNSILDELKKELSRYNYNFEIFNNNLLAICH